jgi:hypothetical protein
MRRTTETDSKTEQTSCHSKANAVFAVHGDDSRRVKALSAEINPDYAPRFLHLKDRDQ